MSRQLRRAMQALMGIFEDEEGRVMGGYKTVKASDGWQFRIMPRSLGSGCYYATAYTVDGEGIVRFGDIGQRRALSEPLIELVEIAKPEPMTPSCCSAGCGACVSAGICFLMRMMDEGAREPEPEPSWHMCWNCMQAMNHRRDMCGTLVYVCERCEASKAEPEASDGIYVWEIDGANLESIDRYDTLHMDSNGQWEVRWYGRSSTYGVTGSGQAKRVQ